MTLSRKIIARKPTLQTTNKVFLQQYLNINSRLIDNSFLSPVEKGMYTCSTFIGILKMQGQLDIT